MFINLKLKVFNKVDLPYSNIKFFLFLVVGFLVVRLFGIDPLIALLGSAPGGTLGMSLVGAELGVGAAVAAIHAFRLIAVLLITPAVVKYLAPIVNVN